MPGIRPSIKKGIVLMSFILYHFNMQFFCHPLVSMLQRVRNCQFIIIIIIIIIRIIV